LIDLYFQWRSLNRSMNMLQLCLNDQVDCGPLFLD